MQNIICILALLGSMSQPDINAKRKIKWMPVGIPSFL